MGLLSRDVGVISHRVLAHRNETGKVSFRELSDGDSKLNGMIFSC